MTHQTSPTSPFHSEGAGASLRVGMLSSIIRGISDNLPNTGVLAVGLSQGWNLAMPGDSLMFTAGVLVGCLLGAKSGVERWDSRIKSDRIFDAPETRDIIARIAAAASDVSSIEKGTVWLVKYPSEDLPVVMTEAEYRKFKRGIAAEGRHLDEIKVDGRGVTVRRFVGEGLDSGDRDLPAFERFELSEGTLNRTTERWFTKGRPAAPRFSRDAKDGRDTLAGYGYPSSEVDGRRFRLPRTVAAGG